MVNSIEAVNAAQAPPATRPVKDSLVKILAQSTRATLVLALLTGVLFPLGITGIGQLLFPHQANGSIVKDNRGQPLGSSLLAQRFEKINYFHPRPSAAGSGFAGEASGGTNLGPTSKKLFEGQPDDAVTKDVNESFDGVKQLADAYRKENGLPDSYLVPIDAVTRSGSGLDPEISIENAKLQAVRIARVRRLPLQVVLDQIEHNMEGRQLAVLGEPRVNVLILNLSLDKKAE